MMTLSQIEDILARADDQTISVYVTGDPGPFIGKARFNTTLNLLVMHDSELFIDPAAIVAVCLYDADEDT
jgi:hypothetical protein